MRVLQRRWQCKDDVVREIVKIGLTYTTDQNRFSSAWPFGKALVDSAMEHWVKQDWWNWLWERRLNDPKVDTYEDQNLWQAKCSIIFEIYADDFTYALLKWNLDEEVE